MTIGVGTSVIPSPWTPPSLAEVKAGMDGAAGAPLLTVRLKEATSWRRCRRDRSPWRSGSSRRRPTWGRCGEIGATADCPIGDRGGAAAVVDVDHIAVVAGARADEGRIGVAGEGRVAPGRRVEVGRFAAPAQPSRSSGSTPPGRSPRRCYPRVPRRSGCSRHPLSGLLGETDHLPLLTVPLAITVAPLRISTVSPLGPVEEPVKIGVVTFVMPSVEDTPLSLPGAKRVW